MQRTTEGEFCWADLSAQDLDAQTSFYEKLFGWTHEDLLAEDAPPYRMFKKNGSIVCAATPITAEMAAAGVPTMWNIYFSTLDADAALLRATELGGQIAMPATEAMDSGRFAGVQDPVGGRFFVWQARAFSGAETFGPPGTLAWVDFSTRQPEKAMKFYSELFETWKTDMVMEEPMPYWQVSVAGTAEVGMMPMPPQLPAEVPSNWMLYFATGDADASVAIARELGGALNMDITQAGDFLKWAVLSDPMGAVFAVLQSLRPA